MIEIKIPIRVVSEANQRCHWATRHRRFKKQKDAVRLLLKPLIRGFSVDGKITITLTRYGKRKLDTDNLAGAFKAVRDAIAKLLGIDDGSERLVWKYEQKKGDYAIKIKIEGDEK